MAIKTNYEEIMKKKFNPRYWDSIEEFEQYYLQRISETRADTNYYTNKLGVEIVIPPVDHHPQLKEYEVWSEGWSANEGTTQASLIGKVMARNFMQACHIIMCKRYLNYIEEINNPNYKEYCDPGRWDYEPYRLTDWGCRLFWDEKHARKFCG